jgi:hypothetical protein
MCLVYDAVTDTFVPQDLATYVERTPAFRNKIQEVAGTATLIAPDGTSIVASVQVISDASYLPYSGNTDGDIAYTQDNQTLYIWDETSYTWASTKSIESVQVRYMTMNQPGAITSPFNGTARSYPPVNINITNVNASLGTAASDDFVFDIMKNGVSEGSYTISSGTYVLTPASTSILVNSTDYLSINIVSGTGASDLKVDFTYLST